MTKGFRAHLTFEEREGRVALARKCRTWAELARELDLNPAACRRWFEWHGLTRVLGSDVGGPTYAGKRGQPGVQLADAQANGMTRDEANALAAKIRQYWRAQGYHVETWAIRVMATIAEDGERDAYEVQSDLVDGLPRDWKGRAA